MTPLLPGGVVAHAFGLVLATALTLLLVTEGSGKHHGRPTPSPSPTPSPTATPTPSPTVTPSPTPSPPPPTPSPTPIISVTLAWNSVTDPSLQGYHLWKGQSAGAENILAALVPGSATTATVPVLTGTTYFVVTAYNSAGDSLPSNEVSYTTP